MIFFLTFLLSFLYTICWDPFSSLFTSGFAGTSATQLYFLQYMKFRTTNIKTAAAKEILISHMHIQLLTARAIFFALVIFGYWHVFRMMCNSLSPLISLSYTSRFIFNVASRCNNTVYGSTRQLSTKIHKLQKEENIFFSVFWSKEKLWFLLLLL